MVKVILHGSNGHMGRIIDSLIAEDPEIEIVAGVDRVSGAVNPYPVFSSIENCEVQADVIIDFANASAEDALLDYCVTKRIPLVLCTTGLSEAQLDHVREAEKHVAVLKSANMSLGINTLIDLLHRASDVFCRAGFDVEIVEKHHRRKLDAPSGTAIALADAVNESQGNVYHYVYDRSQRRQARDDKEIGISAVRGGSIVGEHEVIFAGMDELITFRHTAYSRAVFGKGAIEAAKFLAGKGAGHYDMADVIAAD
ncbi:4-hydroxy-tetrahydrodipicolinate reductase [Shuttleworthella satelles]|uniref:4-hydroxy-tetrahydrodipicolinate reductase n=1 Tax=Shuttleworthella satelles TaxID=177972 RepID=UPI0028D00668|nr:4-hydroxy-tetrahydrodipicolinate reductase [Shuttleworthia satelles]